MLSDKEIVCPNNLLNVAHKKKGVVAGIVNAGNPLPMCVSYTHLPLPPTPYV